MHGAHLALLLVIFVLLAGAVSRLRVTVIVVGE